VTWTLTEYCLHRFVFHYPARSGLGKRFVYLFHGNHHDDPRDKTRLVMPPAGAIPIMAALFFLFGLVIPAPWIEPFGAFFIVGYLIYDYIHYATHHFPMKNPVAKYLRRYHLKHHYSGEPGRYGVSSPLWDIVFGTTGASR
jgi:sterol desaturase/sphingolipid hydroxylase (fatty acid hydroxylase superfamily)